MTWVLQNYREKNVFAFFFFLFLFVFHWNNNHNNVSQMCLPTAKWCVHNVIINHAIKSNLTHILKIPAKRKARREKKTSKISWRMIIVIILERDCGNIMHVRKLFRPDEARLTSHYSQCRRITFTWPTDNGWDVSHAIAHRNRAQLIDWRHVKSTQLSVSLSFSLTMRDGKKA